MSDGWTYGAEHELADWDRAREPELRALGHGLDLEDHTMVNSNGIAVDPRGALYDRGGEVTTAPTRSPADQACHLAQIRRVLPDATVNYRSNLHVHVRVPGLESDLITLKRLASFGQRELPEILPLIEPIPEPVASQYATDAEYRGALMRRRRRRVSHQTIITEERLMRQVAARTIDAFFEAEVPSTRNGRPQWHFAPRHAVNLRHLRAPVPTIEFRHFPGTLDPEELLTAAEWCRDYLLVALDMHSCRSLHELYRREYAGRRQFPTFRPYSHWHEVRYRATCHDGSLRPQQIRDGIRRILEGRFES